MAAVTAFVSSANVITSGSLAIPPRRKRAPREKLSYLKCTFCRRAKVKCLPEKQRQWPHEKCVRCKSKNLKCSPPQLSRMTAEVLSNDIQHRRPPEVDHVDAISPGEEDEVAKDASVLLSIQLLLQMAIEELYLYAFEIKVDILYPSYGGEYIESADFFAGFLESLIHEIESRLQSANSPAIRRLLHRAHKDMAYVSPTERKDEPILEYERNGHGCFAYILHLYQVRKGMRLNKEQTEALCRTRKTFMGAWKNALRTSGIHDTDAYHELLSFGMDLLESQVFTPREALKIPSIMQDVRKDGRMDVLMRTIAFMEHDAGIRRPWPEDTLKEKDLLDRTSIDLACLRKDSNLLEQIVTKEPSILKWCPEPFSIAIAASLGYLAPIEALRKYNEVEFRARILDASTMHVAAATGQVNIAKYLLEHLPTEDLIYAKEFFTGLVPCQYAAKAGQVQMLDLLCDKDANCRQIVDDEGRPLSWYAREEDHIELAQQLAALENARPPPASNSTSRTSPPAGTPPAARSVSWEGPSQAAIPHLEQVPQPQTESLATSLAAKTPHICDDCSTLLFGSRDELLRHIENDHTEMPAVFPSTRTEW